MAAGLTVCAAGFRRVSPKLLALLIAGGGAAAALLSWLSLTEQVQQRAATLMDSKDLGGGRLELWGDVARMAPDFWCSGTGLGTFGFVQPMYQSSVMTVWYDQAENMFLQVFTEAGVMGLAAAVALL